MRVGLFGSRDWNNYSDFVRAMTVFIQEAAELGHDNVVFVHTDSIGAERMIIEYVDKTKKFLRHNNFKIKDESVGRNIQVVKDMSIIESGIDYALIFSTGCKRTYSCQKLLKEYNIPYKLVESA